MKKVAIAVDTSGFVYDPETPTINIERLAYAELQVLQAMSSEGVEVRQVQPGDIITARSAVDAWNTSLEEEGPDFLPTSEDYAEILSCGVSPLACGEVIYNRDSVARQDHVGASIEQIYVVIQEGFNELQQILTNSSSVEALGHIREELQMLVAQETILQLSDGTKILWKSEMIDS